MWGNYCNVLGGPVPVNIYYSTDGGQTVKIAYSFGRNPHFQEKGTEPGSFLGDPANPVICRHIHAVAYHSAERAFYFGCQTSLQATKPVLYNGLPASVLLLGDQPMQQRFELRKQQLLAECDLGPETFDGIIERLADFAQPFAACLVRDEQRRHAHTYLAGLVSDLKRKNTEAIAYRHDLDRNGLQHFVGSSSWDHQPLLGELARQVGTDLGDPDGVIVFDPSGFAKKGIASVGVKRQWLGRLGKVDNGQVGIFMGYVSPREHALVDVRLYLPKEWAADKKRRKRCGVPRAIRYRTRHELALEMLRDKGDLLPHAWVAGDDEMGRSSRFRADLRAWASATCWPSRRTRRSATWRAKDPPGVTLSDGSSGRSSRSGPGPRPSRRRHGVGSRSAAARRGRWSWTS